MKEIGETYFHKHIQLDSKKINYLNLEYVTFKHWNWKKSIDSIDLSYSSEGKTFIVNIENIQVTPKLFIKLFSIMFYFCVA